MMKKTGYLRHVTFCNRADMTLFVPFYLDGVAHGFVKKNLPDLIPYQDGFTLAESATDFASRTAAMGRVAAHLSAKYGRVLCGEMYPVLRRWGDTPLAQIDRAAVPWFGVPAFGIHVNGYVRKKDGIHLWIGERAADRAVDPGLLDNMIGGGQPIGYTLEENLCKEAKEEAGIEPALAKTARLIGPLSDRFERHQGLRNDTLFVYDLELDEDFVPRNTDGEVAAFHLMPVAEVAALVHDTDTFKFNCNLVIIDFLMRHGFLTPEHADYAQLAASMTDRN